MGEGVERSAWGCSRKPSRAGFGTKGRFSNSIYFEQNVKQLVLQFTTFVVVGYLTLNVLAWKLLLKVHCTVQQQKNSSATIFMNFISDALRAWPIILIRVKEVRARKYILQFFVMFIHYSARFHRLIDLRGKLTDRKSKRTHSVQDKRHWHQLASRTRNNTHQKQLSHSLSSHSLNTQRTHYETRILITSYSKESTKLFSQFRRNTVRVSCIVTFEKIRSFAGDLPNCRCVVEGERGIEPVSEK